MRFQTNSSRLSSSVSSFALETLSTSRGYSPELLARIAARLDNAPGANGAENDGRPVFGFTLGASGSGKSACAEVLGFSTILDCDAIKKTAVAGIGGANETWDPSANNGKSNAPALHSWSARILDLLTEAVISAGPEAGKDILLDSTGCCLTDLPEIMARVEALGWHTELYFVEVTGPTAHARNLLRKRSVPAEVVDARLAMVPACWVLLRSAVKTALRIDNEADYLTEAGAFDLPTFEAETARKWASARLAVTGADGVWDVLADLLGAEEDAEVAEVSRLTGSATIAGLAGLAVAGLTGLAVGPEALGLLLTLPVLGLPGWLASRSAKKDIKALAGSRDRKAVERVEALTAEEIAEALAERVAEGSPVEPGIWLGLILTDAEEADLLADLLTEETEAEAEARRREVEADKKASYGERVRLRRALWLATVADRTAGPLGWLPKNETVTEALARLETEAPEALAGAGWRRAPAR